MRHLSGLIVLLLLTACTESCSIGLAPARIVEGKEFSAEKVALIQEGMTADQVHEVLGQPLRITRKGDSETWEYFFRLRQDDLIRVLGVIPIRRPLHIWEREAKVMFRKNRAEKIDFADRRIK